MIFPQLKGTRAGYLNLEECARRHLLRYYPGDIIGLGDNPLMEAYEQEVMMEDFQRLLGISVSYGGWMEFRPTLWRGSYLDKDKKYLHLGLDLTTSSFNVSVALDLPGRVVWKDSDHPEKHGWGQRIFVEVEAQGRKVILVYAHLQVITHKIGDELAEGNILGNIALSKNNGGWWPHVHVQAMTENAWSYFKDNLPELDGYGKLEDIGRLADDFPDPMQFIKIS